MENGLEQQVLAKAQKWLDGNYDAETKKQVKYLMDNDMKELVESFYKDLEFGTGGLRGVMGVGTNRMNIYTVGAATQGLSNYLKRNFAGEEIRVVVGHDSRNNSRMFAERVADIFASNGFTVFLFDALRPTPELSFAIREPEMSVGRGHHGFAQPQRIQRIQGLLERRIAGYGTARQEHHRRGGEDHRGRSGAYRPEPAEYSCSGQGFRRVIP